MCIGSQFDGRVVVDRFEIMDIWNFFFCWMRQQRSAKWRCTSDSWGSFENSSQFLLIITRFQRKCFELKRPNWVTIYITVNIVIAIMHQMGCFLSSGVLMHAFQPKETRFLAVPCKTNLSCKCVCVSVGPFVCVCVCVVAEQTDRGGFNPASRK